jgi:hypothetical protein
MISRNAIFIGILTAVIFTTTSQFQSIDAAPLTLDIKRAANPGPGFGDEKIGTVTLDATADTMTLNSNVTAKPGQDKVFEGWLVDSQGSNYKLSVGKFNGANLTFSQAMVNPFTYSQFIITEEPENDLDPNSAPTYGGTDLRPPFSQ